MRNGCDEDRSLKVTSFSIIICILMFLWAPIVRRGVRHREKEIETEPASRSPSHYDPRFECNMISFLQLESYFLSQGVSVRFLFHSSLTQYAAQPGVTNGVRNATRSEMEVGSVYEADRHPHGPEERARYVHLLTLLTPLTTAEGLRLGENGK